jgi:hypothetical protein
MLFQPNSPAANLPMPDQLKCLILDDRQQYGFCHLLLPDETKPSPGIVVNGQYYSLLKVVKDRQKSRQIATRLVDKGYWVAITSTPKGEVMWTLEPQAIPVKQMGDASAQSLASASSNYRVLRSPTAYEVCQILVPDLAKPLTAIKVNSRCYGLLRRVSDEKKAIALANRLNQRASETVITQNVGDFAVWVLEPDADLIA